MPNRDNALTLRFLAQPTDVNFGGNVHGGAVMKWIDQAAYACAAGWCKSYCVTVYVGGIRFYKPIRIGNIVEVQARVIYTGRTSMHISVDVWAGDPQQDEYTRTTHCIVVFVAVDENGNPIEVAKWVPESEADQKREQYAIKLMELRKSIEDEMTPFMRDE